MRRERKKKTKPEVDQENQKGGILSAFVTKGKEV